MKTNEKVKKNIEKYPNDFMYQLTTLEYNLKEQLKQKGLQNEEIIARINKLFAEADKERAAARKTRAESDQLEFMNLVRKLRMVLEAQKLMNFIDDDHEEIKKISTFIEALKEILKDWCKIKDLIDSL